MFKKAKFQLRIANFLAYLVDFADATRVALFVLFPLSSSIYTSAIIDYFYENVMRNSVYRENDSNFSHAHTEKAVPFAQKALQINSDSFPTYLLQRAAPVL